MIDKAFLHFSDQSIEPNCLFDVQEFAGTVKGLSSRQDARAVVDMRGKVEAGRVSIRSPQPVSPAAHGQSRASLALQ